MRKQHEDSTVVSIEKDTLFYTSYYSDGTDSRREIIPVNKSYFRTESGDGFYQVVYDEKGDIERIDFSNYRYWGKAKKNR